MVRATGHAVLPLNKAHFWVAPPCPGYCRLCCQLVSAGQRSGPATQGQEMCRREGSSSCCTGLLSEQGQQAAEHISLLTRVMWMGRRMTQHHSVQNANSSMPAGGGNASCSCDICLQPCCWTLQYEWSSWPGAPTKPLHTDVQCGICAIQSDNILL